MPVTPSFDTPDGPEFRLPPPPQREPRRPPRPPRTARAPHESPRRARFGDLPSDVDDLLASPRHRRTGYREARESYDPRDIQRRRHLPPSVIASAGASPGLTGFLTDSDPFEDSLAQHSRVNNRLHVSDTFEDADESPDEDGYEDIDEEEHLEDSMSAAVTETMERSPKIEPGMEDVPMPDAISAKPEGMKEIGNLASWTVSTCKPGSGVEALRSEDTDLFWQSDGPQPHHLNIHFSRQVSISAIRIYLDFEADESYTPTKLQLLAGTGYHDLLPFSHLDYSAPKGWLDVELKGCGGGKDGNELNAFLVQLKILENHQNGKDTHVRGLKIFAKDEKKVKYQDGINLPELGQDVMIERELMNSPANRVKLSPCKGAATKPIFADPDWLADEELR